MIQPNAPAAELQPVPGRQLRWQISRCILGLVLLVAAVLKAYELATLPLLGSGFLNQRWLLAVVVAMELVLGTWLLVGKCGFWTWGITLAIWAVFLGVAGYEAMSGADSCGCFGRVKVNPWYTAGFDAAIVLILPFCIPRLRPAPQTARFGRLRFSALALAVIAGAGFGIWNLNRYSPSRLSGDGLSVADGTIILEPQKWVGHHFTLSNYIDIGPKLLHGDWIVLLYRYDCDHCQRAVPRYAEFAAQHPASLSIALVEIPPFAPAGQELTRPEMAVALGKLGPEHDWFASTPVAVRLKDGVVEAVAESDAAEDPERVQLVLDAISTADFPAEHEAYLRTISPIERIFAAWRL